MENIMMELQNDPDFVKIIEFIAKLTAWFFSGDIFQITGRIIIVVIAVMILRLVFLAIAALFCVIHDKNELREMEENRRQNLNGADMVDLL